MECMGSKYVDSESRHNLGMLPTLTPILLWIPSESEQHSLWMRAWVICVLIFQKRKPLARRSNTLWLQAWDWQKPEMPSWVSPAWKCRFFNNPSLNYKHLLLDDLFPICRFNKYRINLSWILTGWIPGCGIHVPTTSYILMFSCWELMLLTPEVTHWWRSHNLG